MKHLPAVVGVLAFACASFPASAQLSSEPSNGVLSGTTRLACEAILCLSSSLQPGECSPSLGHYFDIKVLHKGSLDWGATVDARRAFLGMCPASSSTEMPGRLDAISRGAGKCTADYLNNVYASTSYRYKPRNIFWNGGQFTEDFDVTPIKTVTLSKLPSYCVAYNDHEWTYELGIKYVGEPLKGGYWIKASSHDAAQAKWNADHSGAWAEGWEFSWTNPNTTP
ncbi:conjugal transfer protein TrbM [Allopusillimonas ginsengisoli]|nr:conjugal transfer protein TrbM [Allopusillimonas ginsengisoli]